MKRLAILFFGLLTAIALWSQTLGSDEVYHSQKETSELRNTAELEALNGIKNNTEPNFYWDDVNFIGIFALIVALASFIYAKVTYEAQKKTEGNTKKLSQEAQRNLLNELIRHLYRNFVITYTMYTKMKDIDFQGYPSEEHFIKLKVPMENIHLEAFYGEDEKFQYMHILYLNLRNYNIEVDVALNHIKNPNISIETKKEDFKTLEFKIFFLINKIRETIREVWGEKEEYDLDIRNALRISLSGKTNATDNIDVPGSEHFEHYPLKEFERSVFSELYNSEELNKVCEIFNNDVHE